MGERLETWQVYCDRSLLGEVRAESPIVALERARERWPQYAVRDLAVYRVS